MPKIQSVRQLMKKHYKILENVPEWITDSFGELVGNFKMIVWGESANGKTNFLFQFIKGLVPYGGVLYVSLEEGHEKTMQNKAVEYFHDQKSARIKFADHEMSYEELRMLLRRQRSPKFIIIDSLQYWNISYEQYKDLKTEFSTKAFIFISHANGKMPDGRVANQVKYDAGIKVRVEGFIAFIKSRYGGNKPYVIWEDGGRQYWGKDYAKKSTGIKAKKKAPKKEVQTTETE